MNEQMLAVIDSAVNALFIVQPHAAMAVFDGEQAAQSFIDGYEDKASAKFMEIVECTVTLNDVRPRRIGQPVQEIPRQGRYKEVWSAVMALPSGDWLPVECDTLYAAKQLYVAAKTHRTLSFIARRQGVIVYIQKKPVTKFEKHSTRT